MSPYLSRIEGPPPKRDAARSNRAGDAKPPKTLRFRGFPFSVIIINHNPSSFMIELYQIAGSAPIFVSHEDFTFVKDFILERIPETAEVEYE